MEWASRIYAGIRRGGEEGKRERRKEKLTTTL